jgi:hypothetical protein
MKWVFHQDFAPKCSNKQGNYTQLHLAFRLIFISHRFYTDSVAQISHRCFCVKYTSTVSCVNGCSHYK